MKTLKADFNLNLLCSYKLDRNEILRHIYLIIHNPQKYAEVLASNAKQFF